MDRPSRPQLLMMERLVAPIQARLEAEYTVHHRRDLEGQDGTGPVLDRIEAVVTGGGTGLGNDWIDRLPRLGIVVVNGVGTDRIDLARARSRGVHVTTTPGALTEDVADMGMALILAVLRRVVEGDVLVRSGRWAEGEALPLGASLRGRKLGVLGLGQIGRALGRRAEAFGMGVRFWNRTPVADLAWPALPDPVALAEDSDVLAICVAAHRETQGLVGAEALAALGSAGVLVNVARGSIVDEPALIAALRAGRIAGAGLDVFENEPRIRSEFLTLPNAVLAPHQGSATLETRVAMGEMVLENLAAHFAGRPPPHLAN